ncbi:hypothetical protein D9C73_018039 [Collichthys lucidus]|uniref:Uncharacterized protein n=1 Tax=Collichthys lucidus TaxID=240159 RepID=A0A4U5V7Y6_COLLU|nr:hypothetical protein D9C73_018039 [Collichthys lucidus]
MTAAAKTSSRNPFFKITSDLAHKSPLILRLLPRVTLFVQIGDGLAHLSALWMYSTAARFLRRIQKSAVFLYENKNKTGPGLDLVLDDASTCDCPRRQLFQSPASNADRMPNRRVGKWRDGGVDKQDYMLFAPGCPRYRHDDWGGSHPGRHFSRRYPGFSLVGMEGRDELVCREME